MHVVLNMAASLDGRVAKAGGEPLQLSSGEDLRRVHRLRAASDAIVVGIGTVLTDDPHLTARPEDPVDREDQPLRVVVDSRLRIPEGAAVLDEAADTLVLTGTSGELPGAQVQAVPGDGEVDLVGAFEHLDERGVEQVLIEGGPSLAASALAESLVDRVHLYVAPRVLGEGPSLAAAFQELALELEPRSRAPLGEGTLLSYGVPG